MSLALIENVRANLFCNITTKENTKFVILTQIKLIQIARKLKPLIARKDKKNYFFPKKDEIKLLEKEELILYRIKQIKPLN